MHREQFIELKRSCEAIEIPYGTTVTLQQGAEVAIAQELGGSYTVRTPQGFLFRINGSDADALGLEVPAAAEPAPTGDADTVACSEERIWEVLKTCYDPEIPVNIVDLGLIYGFECTPLNGSEKGCRVVVRMTLTAPGCGMGQVLKDDIEHKLSSLPNITEAQVDIVLDPPWDPGRLSEAARLQLGLI